VVKRVRKIMGALLCLCLWTAVAASQETVTLNAESLYYDPSTGQIKASGNVVIREANIVIEAEEGEGKSDGSTFRLYGNVRGHFQKEGIDLTCDELVVQQREEGRIATAKGNAKLLQGKERIVADELEWLWGSPDDYVARSNVDAVTSVYAVQAQEVGRRGGRFWAKDVKRFEDKAKGITLSAGEIEGNIEGEEIKDLTAVGNVVVKQRTSQGETTLSGNKAVYSKDRGTITVTGKKAVAFQKDRTIRADTLILFLESRRVEAHGSPQIEFVREEKK